MPLRDYQTAAVGELQAAVNRSRTAVYTLPTGGGKTVVGGELARIAATYDSGTLFLVHRRELVKQAVETLEEYCPGLSIGVEAPGWPSIPWATLQVAMVQSLNRRKHKLPVKLVVVDEAHHVRAKTWENVLARYQHAALVGLTATPERLDGKGLGEFFAELILGPSIPELVERGDLAPCRTLTLPPELKTGGVRLDRNGEYREADLSERITGKVIASAADAYLRYARGKKAIFFGIHRDHSRRVCEALRQRGVRAEHVDGEDTAGRRDKIMGDFKTGGLEVVGNCDLISEGFDAPSCEVIMMGAPTQSVTRYLQQAGRAMRPGPGKTAMILDLAGNSHELGLPDDVREWSLEDGEVGGEKKKKRPRPKVCLNCRTAYRTRLCPACGYAAPAAAVEEVETELQDARPRPRKSKRTRAEVNRDLAGARHAPNPRRALEEIAERSGYKRGWVHAILRVWGMAQ